MPEDLVTVATFNFPTEAEAYKLLLEQEGMTAFLADKEVVAMDWFLGNAIGSIKLQTPPEQAERAAELVERTRAERQERKEEPDADEPEACLECGAQWPAEAQSCPACGWSYGENEKEDEEEEEE